MASPPADAASRANQRTAALAVAAVPRDTPVAAASGEALPLAASPPPLQPYPIVIQDHGSSSDPQLLSWGIVAQGALVGSFLLGVVWLLIALKRLSSLQQTTIRVELGEADSASLRLLASRLNLTASGGGENQSSTGAPSTGPARSADPRGRDSEGGCVSPLLRLAARPTTVVDLAEAPFPAAWAGPTFAETIQAAQQRRREQEEKILQSLFDRNLDLVEKLERHQATKAAA